MLRGSKTASKAPCFSSQFGEGSTLGLSLDTWRACVRQAWILGLLEREMKLGKGHNLLGQMVYNSFTLSGAGNTFLEDPHPLILPVLDSRRGRIVSPDEPGKDEKARRKGKGRHAIEGIRSLMSCHEKWFTITSDEDYQFPSGLPTHRG